MAVIQPLSGKTGRIQINGFGIYLEKWNNHIDIDIERYAHFEMVTDANGLIFKQILTGFATAQAQVNGKFDNAPGALLPTNKGIWPGVGFTGFLGYSGVVGFVIGGVLSNISSAQGVDGAYGTFDASLELTSCIFTNAFAG